MGRSERFCDRCGLKEWTTDLRWPIPDGGGLHQKVCDDCARKAMIPRATPTEATTEEVEG